jgi:hypothetical protein
MCKRFKAAASFVQPEAAVATGSLNRADFVARVPTDTAVVVTLPEPPIDSDVSAGTPLGNSSGNAQTVRALLRSLSSLLTEQQLPHRLLLWIQPYSTVALPSFVSHQTLLCLYPIES